MNTLSTLYSKTKTGALQCWSIHTEGRNIVTTYGQVGGKIQVATRAATGKNTGKKNATSPEAQAAKEALSEWKHRVELRYSESPEAAQIPSFLPMLALKYKDRFGKFAFPVDVQRKYNGVRCLASKVNGKVRLMSRGGKTYHCPHIEKVLNALLPEDAVLDGEIYVHGEILQTIASLVHRLQTRTLALQYHVYDVPEWRGKGPERPWSEREHDLAHVQSMFAASPVVRVAETFRAASDEEVRALFERFLCEGYEGAIIRLLGAPYLYEYRSNALLKLKRPDDAEFEIVGFDHGEGRYEHCVKWICVTPEGKRFTVVPKGSIEFKEKMFREAEEHIGEMLTVNFFGYTPEGKPFHPVGEAIRIPEDTDPLTCKKHPRYTALRVPRGSCDVCWKMYNPAFSARHKIG
jgi:DNA ligase 1